MSFGVTPYSPACAVIQSTAIWVRCTAAARSSASHVLPWAASFKKTLTSTVGVFSSATLP